jgi:dTMP kinase
VIAPALERGDIVLCDRFADSTRAYQGFGRGVDLAVIDELNAVATGGRQPDLTVLLDLPPEEGLARATETGDRFGREDEAFHERVRAGYRTLAAQEPERWLVVDAAQTPDMVLDAIWPRVESLLAS